MLIGEEQKEKLREIGQKYDLKLILLHGSYANGKEKTDSDFDVAIMGRKPIDFDAVLRIHGDLSDIFGDGQKRELDLKSLHKIDPLFCYEISKNSRLLFGDENDYSEFQSYAFKNFHDSGDLRRLEKKLVYKFQNYLNKKYSYA